MQVIGDHDAGSHSVEFQEVLRALGSIKEHFAANALGTMPIGEHTVIPPSIGAPNSVTFDLNHCWVPPLKSADDINDYVHHVLGDMGYL